jgi:hypothetical protein
VCEALRGMRVVRVQLLAIKAVCCCIQCVLTSESRLTQAFRVSV